MRFTTCCSISSRLSWASRISPADLNRLRTGNCDELSKRGPAGGIGRSQYPARRFARVQFDRRAFCPAGLVQGVRQFAEVDAGDDARRSRFVAEDRLGGTLRGKLRQPEFQERRLRGIRRQNNPIAAGQPLAGDLPAVHGNSVVALQVPNDPAVGVANDFGVFAGEMRRVEDDVAHHAPSQENSGLVELANDRTLSDLKRELESLIHAVLPPGQIAAHNGPGSNKKPRRIG